MKNLKFTLLAICLTLGSAWGADTFKKIHVADLSQWMTQKDAKLAIFDANTEKVRKTDGVIPGAKLLASSSKYDPKVELPADKSTKLVFYCANTQCTASHSAAEVAIKNGYTDVNVLADGIKGWVKAGKPVTKM